jgi:hypothetical protein
VALPALHTRCVWRCEHCSPLRYPSTLLTLDKVFSIEQLLAYLDKKNTLKFQEANDEQLLRRLREMANDGKCNFC